MAFGKKKRRISTKMIILIISVLLVFLLTVSFAIVKYVNLKTYYEKELQKATDEMNVSRVTVLVPKQAIVAGEALDKTMFEAKEIVSDIDLKYYATSDDFGKYARFGLEKGLPLMNYMVVEELITGDVREEEYNMFLLPSNLKKNQFVDLRIIFPTGENYVVASKIKIRNVDITKNTIWCWLKEREILTVTCAIVDAYVREGSKLYFVTYIEPDVQRPSIVNYKPNLNVISLIENNPNIVENASDALAKSIRGLMEERIKNTDSLEIQMIKQGNDIEIQRRQGRLAPSTETGDGEDSSDGTTEESMPTSIEEAPSNITSNGSPKTSTSSEVDQPSTGTNTQAPKEYTAPAVSTDGENRIIEGENSVKTAPKK